MNVKKIALLLGALVIAVITAVMAKNMFAGAGAQQAAAAPAVPLGPKVLVAKKALQVGTIRYPLTQIKRNMWDVEVDKNMEEGGAQVEYKDQDPRIHALWLDEIAKSGVTSRMGRFIDESRFTKSATQGASA